jgi:hypothetical protein
MVVPVLRNLGILAPWLSRKAFLRQRSKEKPPFGGRSIAVFVISSALSQSHEMAIKGEKQEIVMPVHTNVLAKQNLELGLGGFPSKLRPGLVTG